MVITKVFLKQKRPQLKRWGVAAVTASKTFVRATTGPRAGRRFCRSLRRRSSADEGGFCKVIAASGINICWKCISSTDTEQDERGIRANLLLSSTYRKCFEYKLNNSVFCHVALLLKNLTQVGGEWSSSRPPPPSYRFALPRP